MKFLSLMCSVLVLTACSGGEMSGNDGEVEEVIEPEEVVETYERADAIVASAGQELSDDSGYGFEYAAENVLDLDYSTAWCPGSGEAEIAVNFPDKTSFSTIGIVPGFARDEEIFFQNNRIETLDVLYDGKVVTELEFADEYKMQFFDLPEGTFTKISFEVNTVYPGSKFDDTCLAEIDFWSDWVMTKDADAAMNYYKEHKEAFALRPVVLRDVRMDFADSYSGEKVESLIDSCGQVKENAQTWYNELAGYSAWGGNAGEVPVMSAVLEGYTDGKVTMRWTQLHGMVMSQEAIDNAVPEVIRTVEVTPKQCSDGSWVVQDNTEDPVIGGFKVDFYWNDKFLGSGRFNLAQ